MTTRQHTGIAYIWWRSLNNRLPYPQQEVGKRLRERDNWLIRGSLTMSNLSLTYSFEKTSSPDTHQADSRFLRVVLMLMTLSIAAAILVPNYMHQQMVNEETTVIGITTAIQRRMNGEMAMEILRGTSCPVRLNDRRLLLKNVIASLNLKASHATATVMDVAETRAHIEIELANGTTHTSRIRMPACRKAQS